MLDRWQVLSEADLIAQLLLPLWTTLPETVRSPTLACVQAHWRTLKAEPQLVTRLSDTAFVTTGGLLDAGASVRHNDAKMAFMMSPAPVSPIQAHEAFTLSGLEAHVL